jgi:steroid delta-isomerase-like uncharacterized protein
MKIKRQLYNLICITMFTTTTALSQTPQKSETVFLNGVNIYYEVYGNGTPLLFLHGFTHSSKAWMPYLNDYIDDFEIYLVDLRGHGKSSPFNENLSIKAVAQDIDALVKHLKLDSINAIGYSYGGDVLFQLALLRPGLIKSMVVIGACGICNMNNFPKWVEFLSYKNIDNLPWMREVQSNEEQIKSILAQVRNYNVSVSESEFKSIQSRVLLVIGDNEDSILWEDILKAKNNLPDASLWVVPNTGHGAHKEHNKDDFIIKSKQFFNQIHNPMNENPTANTDLIRKAAQAVNDRDFAFVQSCFTSDFKRHDLVGAFPAAGSGSGEPINFLQELMKAFPDLQMQVEDIFSNGPRATAHFLFTGTHTGELFGHKPTGKKVSFSGINLYRFENGKIAEVWNLWDWLGVMRQIDVFSLKKK